MRLLSILLALSAAATYAQPPNIILILADDQGWNETSVQMDPNVPESASDFHQTVNLEALANQGMVFSNAYSASPICSPTRASILTGKSPAQLQMADLVSFGNTNTKRFSRFYTGRPLSAPIPLSDLPLEETTIPELIKKNEPSYVTGHFGKWHVSNLGTANPEDQGFDHSYVSSAVDTKAGDPKNIFSLTNMANEFLEDRVNAAEPFYLQLWHDAPHHPIEALDSTIEKYQQLPPGTRHNDVGYAAMTEDLDTGVGMLLQKVKDLGIEDNTYIVYVSDNGGSTIAPNDPLFSSKGRLWEGGIRVPMIVKGPQIPAGSVSDVPVVSMDLYSTIGALAGVPETSVPAGVEGANLLPLLTNDGQLPAEMPSLRREYSESGEVYFHFPRYRTTDTTPGSAVRDGDYKLVRFYGENGQPDRIHLFNLANNLTENDNIHSHINLANAMPEKTAELLGKLDNWLQSVDASLPYTVSDDVELIWQAGSPGLDANAWRSTIDVDHKARETWSFNAESQPQLVSADPSQPGLSAEAFRFDGSSGMTRKFFHVSDPKLPDTYDNDHSSTFEFWLRFDSLASNQVIFESGDGASGLSLTLGDADGDGKSNDLRFRVLGDDGKNISVTSQLDQFIDPTSNFVQIVTVFSDSELDRYAEIYVNGTLADRVVGVAGPGENINWDGFMLDDKFNEDSAGLGSMAGEGLGADGGSGDLPFVGGNLQGDLSFFRFYNQAISGSDVLDIYNDKLFPGDFDDDGDVDGFDLLELQRGLGTVYDESDLAKWEENFGIPRFELADFDRNGRVDGLDFLLWQRGETPQKGSLAELEFWEEQYRLPPTTADFDQNGRVDGLDFLLWQSRKTPQNGSAAELALWEAEYRSPPTTADFDNNGRVDALDFLLWQRGDTPQNGSAAEFELWQIEFGSLSTSADFDENGIVDGMDFLRWQRGETMFNGSAAELALWESEHGTLSSSTSSSQQVVPEPSTGMLLLSVFLMLGTQRYTCRSPLPSH